MLQLIAIDQCDKACFSVSACLFQARDRLRLCLGEKAPTLVPVSQVMMCMNCTSDFSLTLRRHHCHGCGRVSHAQIKHSALKYFNVSQTGCNKLCRAFICAGCTHFVLSFLMCLWWFFLLLFDTDCLSELLQEQISTEIHERPHGQSV